MKTEHRHELQTNELADKLGGVIQQVKPYANLIVGVAVILAGIVVVTQLWASRNKEKQERAWSSYFMAQESPGGAESLKEVASSFAGTPASEWALQAAADRHLREGYSQLFEDRGAAAEELKAAKETYEQLLNTTSRPTLKMRAQYGLAQTEESLGSLDNALNQYKSIADAWPDSVVGKAAQEQVNRLSDPRAKDFYSWFATQKPVKRDPNAGLFNNLNNLPADPDISAPGPGELFNSTGGDDTST
ncbi:MAG: hypothetical protein KDA87_23390, partial [Planctomycetales bacterium]|nr:hypothetical protein [Planctomycetales bacterium]